MPGFQEAVFKLNENNRYPDTVFENNKGSFVVRWEAYEGIDEKTYQKEKDTQRLSLMQKKHMRLFETWLENLKENAEIKIIHAAVAGYGLRVTGVPFNFWFFSHLVGERVKGPGFKDPIIGTSIHRMNPTDIQPYI